MKSTFRFLTVLLAASVFFILKAEAQVADYGKENGVLSFEEDLGSVTASRHSLLGVSADHNKLGKRSLVWNWSRKGAYISFNEADYP